MQPREQALKKRFGFFAWLGILTEKPLHFSFVRLSRNSPALSLQGSAVT
jgi:hypothetical protein